MSASIPFINLDSAVTVTPRNLTDDTNASFADTFRRVVERIKKVRRTSQARIAISHGKDSTLLLNAALQAHIELMATQEIEADAQFICTNIDTGVDDIFVRGQILREVADLRAYCEAQGVNLKYMTAKPPARYSWAVMYCSGMKLPSFVKSSADCSVILKIDPAKRLERELVHESGDSLVTLLGSRSDESARRAASIKKHSNSVDEIVIDGGNGSPRTCAPMMDLTDGDVFGILRRMGTNPIIKTNHPIPSYAPHHKLIIKLYGDAQETCPVTSFADAIAPKAGSCGASRFGCTLCLKVTKDKSATARSASAQYAAATNVLAIRDWLAHHAEDMSLREPLAKSVCPVTQTLVVQENTFNGPTLEKLIYWLCQATRDDRLRAERFNDLVDSGQIETDPGYMEIMQDDSLSGEDKAYFAQFYIESHKRHMLQLIDLEQILLISAIHARDGVKLPPYHALWIWNEVENGRYIPYPTINGPMKSDTVPEPRFVQCTLPKTVKMHLGDVLMDSELSCGERNHSIATQKVAIADVLSLEPLKRPSKHSFTKRKVINTKRKGGKIVSVTRGRMGTQLPPARMTPALDSCHKRVVEIEQAQHGASEHDAIAMLGISVAQDANPGGMAINVGESLIWFMEMEFDRIMLAHEKFVSANGVYRFGGIRPMQHMLSFGVLQLTAKALRSTDLMLMRTDMLFQSGLLDLSPSQLKSRSLSQSEYRSLRAATLLRIRDERNRRRKALKDDLAMLRHTPEIYIATRLTETLTAIEAKIGRFVIDGVMMQALVHHNGDTYFDGVSSKVQLDRIQQNINGLDKAFGTAGNVMKKLGLPSTLVRARKAAAVFTTKYHEVKRQAYHQAFERIEQLQVSLESAASLPEVLVANTGTVEHNSLREACAALFNITRVSPLKAAYKRPEEKRLSRLTSLVNSCAA